MADERPSYETYDDFLRVAIRRCWERKSSDRTTFLALMLATRHAWSVALGKSVSAEAGKKLLTGAAGMAAVAVLIRAFLGGPLGLLLTGASAVSLIAVYGKNTGLIGRKVGRYRTVIRDYEPIYDELVANTPDSMQRELMLDGLVSRFLDELEKPLEDEKDEPTPKAGGSFADHVRRQEESEER